MNAEAEDRTRREASHQFRRLICRLPTLGVDVTQWDHWRGLALRRQSGNRRFADRWTLDIGWWEIIWWQT